MERIDLECPKCGRKHQAIRLDGGPLSQRTGAALIAKLDAGCDDA